MSWSGPASTVGTPQTVRKLRPSLVVIATSGRTASAGGSDDHIEEPPPSGANAKPVDQTAPAPAGSPGGSSATRSCAVREQRAARSENRSGPLLTISAAAPRPAREKPRSGCSQLNQRSVASRDPAATAVGSTISSSSTVAETIRPPCARDRALSNFERSGPAWTATLIRVKRVAPSRTLASVVGLGAGDRDLARADHLDQAVRADHPLKGLDLVGAARDLDGQRAAGDI